MHVLLQTVYECCVNGAVHCLVTFWWRFGLAAGNGVGCINEVTVGYFGPV